MSFEEGLIIVLGLMPGGKIKIFVPAVLWAIIMLTVSSVPYLSTPSIGFDFEDKFAHSGEYAVFGILLAFGFSRLNWGWKKVLLISVAVAAVFGILDELHQVLIPGRQADVFDILADMAGAIGAIGIYLAIIRRKT